MVFMGGLLWQSGGNKARFQIISDFGIMVSSSAHVAFIFFEDNQHDDDVGDA